MVSDVFLGASAVITLRVVDANGAPEDPTTITLTIVLPDGSTVGKTKADFTSTTTGTWTYWYPTTQLGQHVWTAATTAPDGATGGYFDVTNRVAYVDVDQVRRVLAGSENLSGTAAGLSDEDIADAISRAQTEVDGRLAVRYATPFTDPPQMVVDITLDVAAYLATLTSRRGEQVQAAEPVALSYQRAQSLLGQVAGGQIPLTVLDQTETANSTVETHNPYDGDLFQPDDFGLGLAPVGWVSGQWPGGRFGGF